MARISGDRTIRVSDETFGAIKALGDKFGLSGNVVVSNAIRLLADRCEKEGVFPLISRDVAIRIGTNSGSMKVDNSTGKTVKKGK